MPKKKPAQKPVYTFRLCRRGRSLDIQLSKDGSETVLVGVKNYRSAAAWIRANGVRRLHGVHSDLIDSPKFRFSHWRDNVLKELERIAEREEGPPKDGEGRHRLWAILRPVVHGRTVVVCHEKHGNRYFVVDDEHGLFRLAYSVVRGRLEEGHWYYEPKEEDRPKDEPDFGEADIEKMPKSFQDDARKRLASYSTAVTRWEKEREYFETIKTAVEARDGYFCWLILRDRSDGEYERVSLEPAEESYSEVDD